MGMVFRDGVVDWKSRLLGTLVEGPTKYWYGVL
jgi:hypothetical protein